VELWAKCLYLEQSRANNNQINFETAARVFTLFLVIARDLGRAQNCQRAEICVSELNNGVINEYGASTGTAVNTNFGGSELRPKANTTLPIRVSSAVANPYG
jgi:hypothetical protein